MIPTSNSKACGKCGQMKSLDGYNKYEKRSNGSYCRDCLKIYRRLPLNMLKENERKLWYTRRLRGIVIGNYGGQCVCCGCDEDAFLQIDHINNDGKTDREENRLYGNRKFYNYIIKNKFPNIYQLLCANCNHAKQKFGKCVHKCTVEDLLKKKYIA